MAVFPTFVGRLGNEIYFRLCDDKGNRKIIRERFKPHLYIPAPYGTPVEVADAVALRGEDGPRSKTPLMKMEFDNIYDFTNYLKENKDVPGVALYGQENVVFQAIARAFPKDIEPSFKHVRCFNLDIEVVSGYVDKTGTMINGPFPEPYIEDEEFRVKKFNPEEYSRHIENFYRWWSSEFPTSKIPMWNNMNAAFPIVSLQLSDMNIGKKIIWDLPTRNDRSKFVYDPEDKEIPNLDVEIREFFTEQEMLADFVKYWAARSPDCWTGWNIRSFDSPYMAERILKVLGEDWLKALSPVGRFRKRLERPKKGVPFHTYDFEGVSCLDYIELYKKHRLVERSRYSLDFIAHVELNERKMDYTESQSLSRLWYENHSDFIRYGIKDINLVDKIDQKLGFLDLSYMLASYAKCNYEDTTGTVGAGLALMYAHNFYHESGECRVPRIKRVQDDADAFDGAFVHTPDPGRYPFVLSEDLRSLYPHIKQQYNMGPETIVDEDERADILFELIEELENFKCDFNRNRARLALIKCIQNEQEIIEELIAFGPFKFETLKRHNVSMTANLQFFINDEMSCYSSITRKLYAARKAFKKEMLKWEQVVEDLKESGKYGSEEYKHASLMVSAYNTKQMGVKILMNSLYGAVGNKWFKEYYDSRIARAITASGEIINKWVTRHLTEFLRVESDEPSKRFVVYGDTDSCHSDTLITVNEQQITIGDFYDMIPNSFVRSCVKTENYVKLVRGTHLSPSVSQQFQIEENNITHVMKHKVKKRMFKIKVAGKEVTITADHSLMVKRDNQLVSIKPTEIQPGDILMTLERG